MPHSSFRSAQRNRNLEKKENNNKPDRTKPKCSTGFACPPPVTYNLRTKHGIYLNKIQHVRAEEEMTFYPGYTEEENRIIHHEICAPNPCRSRDLTHTDHSKKLTKNRKDARQEKRQKDDFLTFKQTF